MESGAHFGALEFVFLLSETLRANLSRHVDEVHGINTDRECDTGGGRVVSSIFHFSAFFNTYSRK